MNGPQAIGGSRNADHHSYGWLASFGVAFLVEVLSVPLDLLLPERGAVTSRTLREFVRRLSEERPE